MMLRASESLGQHASGFVLRHVVVRPQKIDGVDFFDSHHRGINAQKREPSQHTGSDGSEGHALEKVASEHGLPCQDRIKPIENVFTTATNGTVHDGSPDAIAKLQNGVSKLGVWVVVHTPNLRPTPAVPQ